ncbi:type II toxin-antitoxin system VapB family antitoxin [Microbacterium sp. HSID17254]|nr:type II toxin-antitoxin system VapB family antitoxin [Microbacterium sp. HSID17254]
MCLGTAPLPRAVRRIIGHLHPELVPRCGPDEPSEHRLPLIRTQRRGDGAVEQRLVWFGRGVRDRVAPDAGPDLRPARPGLLVHAPRGRRRSIDQRRRERVIGGIQPVRLADPEELQQRVRSVLDGEGHVVRPRVPGHRSRRTHVSSPPAVGRPPPADSLIYCLIQDRGEEGTTMTVTSIDIDPDELKQAKKLAGTTSNRETVDLALRTLIAVRRQPAAVERIIGRRFEAEQIDAPTVAPEPMPERREGAGWSASTPR